MKKIKKILIYYIIFLIICFAIPVILTKKKVEIKDTVSQIQEETTEIQNTQEIVPSIPYVYNKYATIKLLHKATGEIEELPIDEYLYNVVAAEMPVDYEEEALKAQAIVARTYTIYQIINGAGKHEKADICDDSTCCQAWISKEDRFAKWDENLREINWNKIVSAVNETAGKIITYNGEPIDAFFHSNSGGKTEIPVNVWGGTEYPYLLSVETSGEEGYTQYNSSVTISKSDLINKIKTTHPEIEINFDYEEAIKILEYNDSGRVRKIKFGNVELSGVETRTILGLKSANFEVKTEGDNVIFLVKGYGHRCRFKSNRK